MHKALLVSWCFLLVTPAWAGDGHSDCRMKRDKDDRFARGKDVRVKAGEKVHDAIAIEGNVTVQSGAHVRNAMAVGGTVTIEDGAIVDGDVAVVKGAVKIGPKAVVKGKRFELADSVKVDGSQVKIEIEGENLTERVAASVLDELKNCKIE